MTIEMPDLSLLNTEEQKWITALYEVVNERPDFVYPERDNKEWYTTDTLSSCRYFLNNGRPACVWGNVVDRLGIIDRNQVRERSSIHDILNAIYGAGRNAGIRNIIRSWFGEVQSMQDRKSSWGEALRVLDAKLRRYLTELQEL